MHKTKVGAYNIKRKRKEWLIWKNASDMIH